MKYRVTREHSNRQMRSCKLTAKSHVLCRKTQRWDEYLAEGLTIAPSQVFEVALELPVWAVTSRTREPRVV